MLGGISVYKPQTNGDLTMIDYIKLGYGIDNLSFDAKGDMLAAVFPAPLRFFKSSTDPYNADLSPPSAALRVSKTSSGYKVSKAIEDGLGEALPGSTTVLHDAKTGRLFMGGMFDAKLHYYNH
jgi:arylesterase/paraoxonase